MALRGLSNGARIHACICIMHACICICMCTGYIALRQHCLARHPEVVIKGMGESYSCLGTHDVMATKTLPHKDKQRAMGTLCVKLNKTHLGGDGVCQREFSVVGPCVPGDITGLDRTLESRHTAGVWTVQAETRRAVYV